GAQGGAAAAQPVEQAHQWGHGGHGPARGPDRSDARADSHTHGADGNAGGREGVAQKYHCPAHRQDHAHRRDLVAAAGAPWRAEELETDDEEDRSQQVDKGGGDRQGRRPLTISSMRPVTTKPPTTFVVPSTTATKPSTISRGVCA